MRIGIDAANIRDGGGVTHLQELLRYANASAQQISEVNVWAGAATLGRIEERPWLRKISVAALGHGLASRIYWQQTELTRQVRAANCDILFVPGGSYLGSFRPFVVMSQNLLPFMPRERARYEVSRIRLKLHILEWVQAATLRRAQGAIFLSGGARRIVERRLRFHHPNATTIPHGVDERFFRSRRDATPPRATAGKTFVWLYVSIIDPYKHQLEVIEAVRQLRTAGWNVRLELVGPVGWRKDEMKVRHCVEEASRHGGWLSYRGPIPYHSLHQAYGDADAFVFASSCESFGMIPVEAMAAGLPLAASQCEPMPEILGPAPWYFDPANPKNIAKAMREMMSDPSDARNRARIGTRWVTKFKWSKCALDTFAFLHETAKLHERYSTRGKQCI